MVKIVLKEKCNYTNLYILNNRKNGTVIRVKKWKLI